MTPYLPCEPSYLEEESSCIRSGVVTRGVLGADYAHDAAAFGLTGWSGLLGGGWRRSRGIIRCVTTKHIQISIVAVSLDKRETIAWYCRWCFAEDCCLLQSERDSAS